MINQQTALLAHSKPLARQATKMQLSADGWHVIAVSNETEALSALKTHTVQMVVIERGMCDSSGKPLKFSLMRHPKTTGAELREVGGMPFSLPFNPLSAK